MNARFFMNLREIALNYTDMFGTGRVYVGESSDAIRDV